MGWLFALVVAGITTWMWLTKREGGSDNQGSD